MIKINLQLFGGNGANTPDGGTPGGGGGKSNWSQGLGTRVYETAAEALGAQGRPMGVEKATLGANPNYNPQYSEYSENCQRCVIAYEARRRGYDVVAQPTYQGDDLNRGDNFATNFAGAKVENVGATTRAKAQKNLEDKMAQYGDGARAIVAVQWSGASYGHVINVEQKNGKTIYRDAQTGVQYKGNNFFKSVKSKSVTVTRVDNLQFTDVAARSVTKDMY